MPPARYARLATVSDLDGAIAELTQRCRFMRAVHARTGTPPLRDYPAGFEGLAKIITGQQVSASAAAAIWAKVRAGLNPVTPACVLAMSDDGLKALGLSAPKVKTLRALAAAVEERELSFAPLHRLPDDGIREMLTALHGIGPWTADIYLLFSLRRADAFPAGDLALQVAAERLFRLRDRPDASALQELAERWRPWRGAAARLLWADYALERRASPSATPTGPAKKR